MHIDANDVAIVLNGDHLLITAEMLEGLAETHPRSCAVTLATAVLDHPGSYRRVLGALDGTIEPVVETKSPGDATVLELRIDEISAGIDAFERAAVSRQARMARSSRAIRKPKTRSWARRSRGLSVDRQSPRGKGR